MEIEKYRTIEATLDLADDYVPPIRLNTGDMNGRILKFNVTDGGNDVNDLNGLTARLTWNRDPTDPASAGGWKKMTANTNTSNPTGVRQVSFTTPVPRALLQEASERTVVGVDIEDADGNTIASRSIPVLMEAGRLNAKAVEIADPLKDLHDTLDQAQTLVDTASLTLGIVTTLVPSKKATGSMTGTGWQRKLNLSIPRGSKISQLTATALDAETPTVNTSSDGNGDMIVALGLPRGKQGPQGEPGPKGDPGDASNVPIASASEAGIVQIGDGLEVDYKGIISVAETRGMGISDEDSFQAFFSQTVLCRGADATYMDALITFTANPNYVPEGGLSGFGVDALPPEYGFFADGGATTFNIVIQTIDEVTETDVTMRTVTGVVLPHEGLNSVQINFSSGPGSSTASFITVIKNGVCMPSFSIRVPGVKKKW